MGRPRVPREGRVRYQLKEPGKRALGAVDPLESLVSRSIVGSSASVARSWLLPLGPLQEKTRAQCPLTAATRATRAGPGPPGGSGEWLGVAVSPELLGEGGRVPVPESPRRALAWPALV